MAWRMGIHGKRGESWGSWRGRAEGKPRAAGRAAEVLVLSVAERGLGDVWEREVVQHLVLHNLKSELA